MYRLEMSTVPGVCNSLLQANNKKWEYPVRIYCDSMISEMSFSVIKSLFQGPEMATAPSGCDVTFLSEANSLCGDSPRCRYTVRRTIAAMHSLRGDPSSLGCDWQNHPCLARYVAMTLR